MSAYMRRAAISDWLTAIIWLGMHDHCTAEYRVLVACDGNVVHRQFEPDSPLLVRLQIAQVARMAFLLFGQAMFVSLGIVVTAGAHGVGRRTIAELMDVEGMLLPRSEPFDMRDHLHLRSLLSKRDFAFAIVARGGVQDGHGLFHGRPGLRVGRVVLRRTSIESDRER